MIISKSPMRISFLGGTTDFPEYFMNSDIPGYVIGSTIDKYVYVNLMEQPSFEKIKYRFSWRYTENVGHVDEIAHPVLRTVLTKENWLTPLNISTMASLPGRSGLGSSSAFTVALIAAINEATDKAKLSPEELAKKAIQIERIELQEAGGWQDQYQTAVGGLRCYQFEKNRVSFSEIMGSQEFRKTLSESLVLVAMGGGRDSQIHARKTSTNISEGNMLKYLERLSSLTLKVSHAIQRAESVDESMNVIIDGMNEGWELKRIISSHESEFVDEILSFGVRHGAKSGKLCGAGGSGFAAFIVERDQRKEFLKAFRENEIVNVRLIDTGNEVFRL